MSKTDRFDDSSSGDEAFLALDRYLQELHAGQSPDRDGLLAKHPGLASALDCLQALDRLASVSAASPAKADGHLPRTLQLPREPDREDPLPTMGGFEFGKYEILSEIGRGGMGVVYKALQRDLHRVVALKMILGAPLASETEIQRFHAEARAAAGACHQNVVAIHEVGQFHGQHYLAMQYIAGESLAELTRDGPLDPQAAAECLATVARAVHHLHLQGLIHRDLKPSNILVDEAGDPYVTDFGLAKILTGANVLTQTGAIVGTPSYMAPEQAGSRGVAVGPAADVYSLGAILYELLTGTPPFKEDNPLDTLLKTIEGEPTRPRTVNPSIPTPIEAICLKCLEKDPRRRYASALALANDLDRFIQGEMIEARPLGLWGKIHRWGRRQPALASRAAAFAVFYGITLANYFVFHIIGGFFFGSVTVLMLAWLAASVGFQRLQGRQQWTQWTTFAWATADVSLLTAILYLANGCDSPLIVGYLLLIAASGFWSRRRLVLFMTLLSMFSYAGLLVEGHFARPELSRPFDYHLIMLAAMAVMGFIISQQAQRIGILGRYLERQRR